MDWLLNSLFLLKRENKKTPRKVAEAIFTAHDRANLSSRWIEERVVNIERAISEAYEECASLCDKEAMRVRTEGGALFHIVELEQFAKKIRGMKDGTV